MIKRIFQFLISLNTKRLYEYRGDMLCFDKDAVIKMHEEKFTKVLRNKKGRQ